MITTQKLKMDFARQPIFPVVNAVQGDENTRTVEIMLFENGAAWAPPSGVTAAVAFRKPDKTSGLYDTLPDGTAATKISGNTVTATFAPQMLTVPGKVAVAVILYSGESQLGTFPFCVTVAPNPSAGGGVSNDYYHYQSFAALNAAIGDLDDLLTTNKSNLVAAINEVCNAGGNSSDSSQNPTVGTANIYAGVDEPADGSLVWIDTTEEDSSLELNAEKWVTGYWCSATGGLQGSGGIPENGMMMCLSFVPVKAGKKYTIYNTDPDWTCDWIGVNLYEVDDGINGWVKRVTGTGASITITIPDNVAYLIFSSRNLVENDAYLNIRIREEDEEHVHSYTSSVTTAATCTTAGVRTYTCSCGESYTEEIPATGHNYVDGVCFVCGAADPDYNPDVTLSSISATYSGGDVAVGTAVTALTGIVVTANYSDGSTKTVTGYTLSGTIAEGSNTVTVSYGGKTTTFTVTGVAVAEGTGWKLGYFKNDGSIADSTGYMHCEEYVPVTAGSTVYLYNTNAQWAPIDSDGKSFNRAAYYDADKNYVSTDIGSYISWGRWVKYTIPDNVSYIRASAANIVGYDDTVVVSVVAPSFVCAFEDVAWFGGYFNTSAQANTTTDIGGNGEMWCTYISVEPGATYRFGNSNAEWTTDWNRCAYFTDMLTFKQAVQPTNGATLEFTIPDDVYYLAISCRRMGDSYATATFEKVS